MSQLISSKPLIPTWQNSTSTVPLRAYSEQHSGLMIVIPARGVFGIRTLCAPTDQACVSSNPLQSHKRNAVNPHADQRPPAWLAFAGDNPPPHSANEHLSSYSSDTRSQFYEVTSVFRGPSEIKPAKASARTVCDDLGGRLRRTERYLPPDTKI